MNAERNLRVTLACRRGAACLIATWLATGMMAGSARATTLPPAATGAAAVSAWARTHARPIARLTPGDSDADLAPLRAIIGDAHVVSFGEGMHGAAEPLDFRNRLFRFLVERMGFTAIAIESGITEGFEINRYVLGGDGDAAGVVARGITFGLDAFPQQVELVRFMREYNASPAHPRKLEFYGIDVPGTPTDSQATLRVALDYLVARDAAFVASIRARTADLVPMLNLDRRTDAPNQYTHLTQTERDRMSGAIGDVIAQFEIHEVEYVRATSKRAYAVAYRAAIAARQVDDYLRRVPIGWKPADGPSGLLETIAAADRTKADNLQWVLAQLGPGARVLVFAHRDHLAYSRSTIRLPPPLNAWALPPMVGMYLTGRLGRDLVTIGHLFATEATRCGEPPHHAAAESFEAHLAVVPAPFFVLDLRTAPPAVRGWLDADRELFGAPPLNTTSAGNAYDAIFFSREATAAVPCR